MGKQTISLLARIWKCYFLFRRLIFFFTTDESVCRDNEDNLFFSRGGQQITGTSARNRDYLGEQNETQQTQVATNATSFNQLWLGPEPMICQACLKAAASNETALLPLISFREGLSRAASGSFVAASQSPSAGPTLKEPRRVPVKRGLCSASSVSCLRRKTDCVQSLLGVQWRRAPGLSRIEFITRMKRAFGHTVQPRAHFVKAESRRSSGVGGDLPRRDVFVRGKRRASANNHIKVWDD